MSLLRLVKHNYLEHSPPPPTDSINEIEMIRLYDQQATLPKNTVKLKFSTPEPRSTKLKI